MAEVVEDVQLCPPNNVQQFRSSSASLCQEGSAELSTRDNVPMFREKFVKMFRRNSAEMSQDRSAHLYQDKSVLNNVVLLHGAKFVTNIESNKPKQYSRRTPKLYMTFFLI